MDGFVLFNERRNPRALRLHRNPTDQKRILRRVEQADAAAGESAAEFGQLLFAQSR